MPHNRKRPPSHACSRARRAHHNPGTPLPGHEPAGCCHDDHRHDQQTSKYVHGLDHGQAGSSPSGGLISDWASTSETGDEAEDTQSKERVNLVLQEHKGGQDDEFGEHAGHGSERRSELSGCSLDDVDDRLDSRADCVRPGAAPTVSGLALGASPIRGSRFLTRRRDCSAM